MCWHRLLLYLLIVIIFSNNPSTFFVIRYTLEESRRKKGVLYSGFPLNYLICRVSHYCLELLYAELQRMRGLSDEVYDRCGCVLMRTHHIPCACKLRAAVDSETPISVDDIHIFWRTLAIGERVEEHDWVKSNDASEDHQYFRTLVEEVNASDPAVVRNISLLIHNQLHPDQAAYVEPEVNTTVRGRPKGSTSTKREPSKWEYSERGRGRRGGSTGRSSSSGHRRNSSSSVRNASTHGMILFIAINFKFDTNYLVQ